MVALLEAAWRGGAAGAEAALARHAAGRQLLDAAAAERASAVLTELGREAADAQAAAAAKREKRRAAKARAKARRGADAADADADAADAGTGASSPVAPDTPPHDTAAAERAARAAAAAAEYEAALASRRAELERAAAEAAAAAAAAAAARAAAPSPASSSSSSSCDSGREDDAASARAPAAPPPAAADAARCACLERELAASRADAAQLRGALEAAHAEAAQLRRATLGLASINRTLAAVGEGLCITNAHAEVVYVNEGFLRLTGFAKDDCLGRNCAFLQGPGTCPVARRALSVAIAAGRAIRLDILNYRRDGTPFWNDLSITPVRGAGADPDSPVQFYVGIQSDVGVRYAGGGGAAPRPPLAAAAPMEARRAHGAASAAASAALLTPDAIQSLLQLDFVDNARLFCDVHAALA